ncbi:alanine--tRNA ligase [Rhizosphaericola mali]|uniref:Alanine--tRNA ligase n=1 Tax=Rhizosphaericola mali TaxID=2545455 RepID=A0A5P2G895_9BACT|nr:alanine--tRNA ligase [Rhizosphaericola mali]QES89980.1 alanine--tRNA ligase [Rhizosphaericola mali]
MSTSAQIRQQFLDFFHSKGHTIVPSAPIVVKNDPTLLFTNAGMNQFKEYFLGNQTPPYKRAVDTQKCLRVSGKHNDLEEVGVDTYHHTMFEMLGNWSFGDYFKKEAIEWSFELLTSVYKMDVSKLYATVFEGDEKEGLPFDQEAYDEWSKYLPKDHILKGNKKDNFWEMGDTGPCGPCSEIHYDGRTDVEIAKVPGADLVNNDDPQVIEIWNNVFMQFNRLKDGTLQPLPATHVDTGMGFERLVRILQGKKSNYDTDIFTGTIHVIESIVNKKYAFDDSKESVAFRVLSDHIRAICFAISDGQLPSNTGAGYVIRRILRRAVRYYYTYLDYKNPLLFQLASHLAKQFENVFPELNQQVDFVTKVIKEEEDSFLRTLDKGLRKMDDIIAQKDLKIISGKDAFELYDTFGFPIDLTRLIASENNLEVDEKGFESEMAEQKNRSRAATIIDASDWVEILPGATTTFVGYGDPVVDTKVIKYRNVKAKGKDQYQIVLEQTPFYAEMGGQVGDTGILDFDGEKIAVLDTKKENDLIVHYTKTLPANIEATLTARIDVERRLKIMYNHSATHLLHAALREVLGEHVAQKGSLVSDTVLRFDFSHFAKMTDEELRKVEEIVNEKIRANIPVDIQELPKEEAMKLGAMHLFGEKYGDIVRVVTMDAEFSREFCGGTHVPNTGMIGVFTITSEAAVAAGVRRIEALTGSAAIQYFAERVSQSKQVMELLKTKDPIKSIEKLMEDKAILERKLEGFEAKEIAQIAKDLVAKAETINGVQFIGANVEVDNGDALKKICFAIKGLTSDYFVALTASIGAKSAVAILIDDTIAKDKNLDAGKLIKQTVAPLIKGGGGGQPTLATAGGQDASNLDKVIAELKAVIE